VLEFWAEELEERTRDPRSPPPFLSQPRDETERCRQAETALLQESYKYVIMSDDTVLEICHDLWADECVQSGPRSAGRPPPLPHQASGHPAAGFEPCLPRADGGLIGPGAAASRAFLTKLLAIGAALGLRQARETCDGYYQPYTAPIPDPATVWSRVT